MFRQNNNCTNIVGYNNLVTYKKRLKQTLPNINIEQMSFKNLQLASQKVFAKIINVKLLIIIPKANEA
jgi:arylamine N-acetyltransferase